MMNTIPTNLQSLLRVILREDAVPFLAGGTVRDMLLGVTPNDYDVEVYGISIDSLAALLVQYGAVSVVEQVGGKRIIEMHNPDGNIYQFSVATNMRDACATRDYTINAMLMRFPNGEVEDFFNGSLDLARRTLRHTGQAFSRDPLRIERGARFVSRMNYTVAQETLQFFRTIEDKHMAALNEPTNASRVYGEYSRIVMGRFPRNAMLMLLSVNALPAEIAAMVGVKQNPKFHPEGDVFMHTTHVMDQASRIMRRDNLNAEDSLVLGMAALLHDTGKATETTVEDGVIRARGHEDASAEIARSFMNRFGFPNNITEQVVALCQCHMRTDIATPSAVRRLARDVTPSNITMMVRLMEADSAGRPPLPQGRTQNLDTILEIAANLNVQSEQPAKLLMGRHLLALGMQPSPLFGEIISGAYELQLDGVITTVEQGIEYARAYLSQG